MTNAISSGAALTGDLWVASRRATSPAVLAVAVLIAAIVVATGAPLLLAVLAIAPVATAVVPVVVRSPRLAAAALAAVAVSNANDVLASAGIRGVELAATAIGLLALGGAVRRDEVALRWSGVHTAAIVFLVTRAASIVTAQHPEVAVKDVGELIRAIVFFVLLAALASAPGGIRAVAAAAVATTALLAAFSLAQELVLGNGFELFGFSRVPKSADRGGFTSRHAGPETDANFWGRTLVLWVPFALAWAVPALRRLRGFAASAAGILLVAGIYLTQSRGALLAAGLAGVVLLALAGRPYRVYLFLVPVVAAGSLLVPGVGSRLATLAEIGAATQRTGEGSLISRFEVMRQGVHMFLEHPVTGVGAHNFRIVDAEYARRSGLLGVEPMAAHNAYIEMAAEGGIAGLAGWLVFLGAPTYVGLRALRTKEEEHRLAAAAVVSAVVGWGFASLFLHIGDLRPLLLVAAIAVALDGHRPGGLPDPAVTEHPMIPVRVLGVVCAVTIAGLAVAGVSTAGFDRAWVATNAWVIQPERSDDEPSAYDLDIATRPVVGASLAEVIVRAARDGGVADSAISARAIPGRAVVEVRTRARSREAAEALAEEAITVGTAAVEGPGHWTLEGPFATTVTRTRVPDLPMLAIIAVLASAGLLMAGVVVVRGAPGRDVRFAAFAEAG